MSSNSTDRSDPGPSATDEAPAGQLTRRQALRSAAAACGLLALGAALTDVPEAEAATGITTLSDGRVRINLRLVSGLSRPNAGISIGPVRGVPAGVVRTSTGYLALNLRCPHQGAPVNWTGSGWTCPAHNSAFGATGMLSRGPATRGLSTLPVSRRGNFIFVG